MPNELLTESVSNAELLLAYVNRNGIEIDSDTVQSVVTARGLLRQDGLAGAEEKALYDSYRKLAKLVAPVSVASLHDSLDSFGLERQRWIFFGKEIQISYATIACKVQKTWAFFALILLVLVQSYWVVGNNLVEGIPGLRKSPQKPPTAVEATTIPPATPPPAKVGANEGAAVNNATNLDENDKAASRAILLMVWSRPWDWVVKGDYTEELLKSENINTRPLTAVAATHVLDILQFYILPLLYGWLGAMAFVIRTLSREARERTYRTENDLAYRLRIYLGVLSGLAIGWFFKPSETNGAEISSLPPFALAFIAGYSVDLLFTLMDKLLTAFSSQSPTPVKST